MPFIDELHAGELLGKIYDLFEGIDIFVFQARSVSLVSPSELTDK